MRLGARWLVSRLVYLAAALVLVVGVVVYNLYGQEHDPEETGLIEGDIVKVALIGGVLAVVAVISYVYLAKRPPEEGG